MLGISRRGDCYLRTLLVHGAPAAIRNLEHRRDPRSVWAVVSICDAGPISRRWRSPTKRPRDVDVVDQRGEVLRRTPPGPDAAPRLTARRKSEPGTSPNHELRSCERNSDGETGRTGTFSNLTVPKGVRGRKIDKAKVRGVPSGPGRCLITHASFRRGRIYGGNRINRPLVFSGHSFAPGERSISAQSTTEGRVGGKSP